MGNGNVETRELVTGHRPMNAMSPAAIGLTLAEGKSVLAAMQTELVQAQADGYCQHRRICSHCGSLRAVKDWRTRQLMTLFGAVQVEATRFNPCRCGVASRRIVSPLVEMMPDRCTPEYERILTKMGSMAAYGRAAALMTNPVGFEPLSTRRLLDVSRSARPRELRLAGDQPGLADPHRRGHSEPRPCFGLRELERRKKAPEIESLKQN